MNLNKFYKRERITVFKKLKKLIKSLLRKELDDKKIVPSPEKRSKNRKK